MTKKEFLEQLEDTLAGEVSNAIVFENKQYYSKYIDSELWKGREEEEILEELGDPRLLARTIIDMQGGGFFSANKETAYENYRTVEEEESENHFEKVSYKKSKFIGIAVGILGIFLIYFIVRMISTLTVFLVHYGWPILLAGIVWYIMKHLFHHIK